MSGNDDLPRPRLAHREIPVGDPRLLDVRAARVFSFAGVGLR